MEVSATAAVLLDADTGQLLYEKNGDEQMLIASTTKIMTALVALEQAEPDDTVTVTREHMTEGSSMYLKPGETVRVEELLYGLLLCSGNDAALALTECAGGLERLEREALLGRKSGERARREAVRLGLLAGLGLAKAALERLVAPLSPEELEQVEKAWEQKAAERYPLFPPLRYEEREQKETGRDVALFI